MNRWRGNKYLMAKSSTLSRKETREYYDRFGIKQDRQAFYEDPALEMLIKHGEFDSADSVIEFGCGTGRFAGLLLENYLSRDASYRGYDLSSTMVGISAKRIQEYGPRAEVIEISGEPELPLPGSSADRFVSNYVLDILPEMEIEKIISEAFRILKKNGLICLVSITCGSGLLSRIIMGLWKKVHSFKPELLGGCRPVNLYSFIKSDLFSIKYRSIVVSRGIASEVVVASKI